MSRFEEGQRVGDEVGLAVEKAMRGCGKEATDVAEEVLALWAIVHGLVALTMAGRMEGGEEQAERLGEKAVRDALLTWRGG
jgi:Tetracyclin repressor-like, C-terminal domain